MSAPEDCNGNSIMTRKVVLLGSSNAGKTCLVLRMTHGKFDEFASKQSTIGASYVRKAYQFKHQKVELDIWDTAGQERFECLLPKYYRDAKAALICFDLTNDFSFEKAKEWARRLKLREPRCKLYLCATKKDLIDDGMFERARESREVLTLSAETDATLCVETSSKTGENVDELFLTIARDQLDCPAEPCLDPGICVESEAIRLLRQKPKKNCCG